MRTLIVDTDAWMSVADRIGRTSSFTVFTKRSGITLHILGIEGNFPFSRDYGVSFLLALYPGKEISFLTWHRGNKLKRYRIYDRNDSNKDN